MKKLTIILTAVCVLAMANLAVAQPEQYDAGVFFDPAGTVSEGVVAGFVPFFLYVVAFDLDGQVFGFEGNVATPVGFFDPVNNPGGLTILSAIFSGPAPLNVGTNDNFIVGTGGCISGAGAFLVVSYNLGYFAGPVAPADLTFCLGASSPSSFVPAVPGYLRCNGDLQAFGVAQNGGGVYPNGCAVGNATSPGSVVSTVETSFGAVKAGF